MVGLSDFYWLVGLLEGEGCFAYGDSPSISVGMTDRDVIEKLASILGTHVRGPYKYKHNRKPVYYANKFGHEAISWMFMLYPFMGERRRAKIVTIVSKWKLAPTKAHRRKTGKPVECGHETRKHYAHGLCSPCYKRQLYKKG